MVFVGVADSEGARYGLPARFRVAELLLSCDDGVCDFAEPGRAGWEVRFLGTGDSGCS